MSNKTEKNGDGGEDGGTVVQEQIPGTAQKLTKSQLRAQELAEARNELDVKREKVKDRERSLISQMREDKLFEVKVRDNSGILHVFDLEELTRIKHKAYD